MLGKKLTTRLVKARWAWSELTSPRFAKEYLSLGPDAVRLATAAVHVAASFDDLTDSDLDILVSLIEQRQPGFMPALANIDNFVCAGWTKGDLLACLAIPAMSPRKDRFIEYSEFIENPPHLVNGEPEWSDPRVTALSWPEGVQYSQKEPGVAVKRANRNLLLDGYGRSVIFMRHGTDTDRYMVWLPA